MIPQNHPLDSLKTQNTFPGLRVRSANFQKPTEGPIRIFFGAVGLGNRTGTKAMIRSERFIAGIAIVSIIASLGYLALTLIG
jgi:hypothetical protein